MDSLKDYRNQITDLTKFFEYCEEIAKSDEEYEYYNEFTKFFDYGYLPSDLGKRFDDFILNVKDFTTQQFPHLVKLPLYVYFYNSSDFNAFATVVTKQNIIGISSSFFLRLIERCEESAQVLFDKDDDRRITERLLGATTSDFLLTKALQFLFFHELGHLIQSEFNDDWSFATETNSSSFNILSHIKERDSDIVGANLAINLILHDFDSYLGVIEPNKTQEILIAFSMVGVYIMFDTLPNAITGPIYFYESTHPHPIIRIYQVIRIMSDKGNDLIEDKKDLERLLNLSHNLISRVNTNDSASNFLKTIVLNSEQIRNYTAVIIEEREKYILAANKIVERILRGND